MLQRLVYHEQNQEKRFDLLLHLLDEHESIYKDSLKLYVARVSAIAQTIHTKSAVINAGIARVNAFLRFDKLDNATKLVDSLMPLVDSNRPDEKSLFIRLSLQKVNCYAGAAKYEQAIDIIYPVLAMAAQIKDTFSQAQCMNALAVINYNRNNLDDDIRWCRRVQALCSGKEKYTRIQGYCYTNMAAYFAWTEHYDSAQHYIDLAISASEKAQNLYYLANAYIVACNLYKWSGHMNKAQDAMLKAIEIRKLTEGNIIFSNEQLALANLYMAEKQYNKAIAIYTEGIAYANDSLRAKGNEVNYDVLLYYYVGLSRGYHMTGDHALYESSLEHVIALKDTLNQRTSERAIAEMQTKYDVQLKDNTIIRQKLDITQKSFLFYGSLIVLALGLIIAWLLFRNYSRRQRMRFYLAQEEEKRKAVWAVKEAEEKERKRIAADLHDNMGSYAASIKANVEELISQINSSVPAIEQLNSNSQQMVALLGDTIWALKKEELSLSAISDRLKVFLQRLRASYPQIEFSVEEDITDDIKLPPVQAYHLFMMVQEAVNNAVRHSAGNNIIIAIKSDNGWVISVTDNGKGMNNTGGSPDGGNGCYNIRMRALESGWHVSWEAIHPHGTNVLISNTN